MGAKENDLLKWGMQCIGAALRRTRKEAQLKVHDFGHDIGPSSVKMIEAGRAMVPIVKTGSYAAALNNSRRGPKVDPDSLASAYASLRAHDKGYVAAGIQDWERFNWAKLYETYKHDKGVAAAIIFGELTRSTLSPQSTNTSIHGEVQRLNPIQQVLLEDIAARLRKFGNDVLSDAALGEWETLSLRRLRSVQALTASLESELSDDYVTTFQRAIKEGHFQGYKYIVLHDGKDKDIERVIEEIVANAFVKESDRRTFRAKFLVRVISTKDFTDFMKTFAQAGAASWGGLYLYDLGDGSDGLLLGVLRRAPGPLTNTKDVSLSSWGGVSMNEALPTAYVSSFSKQFETLWKKSRQVSG